MKKALKTSVVLIFSLAIILIIAVGLIFSSTPKTVQLNQVSPQAAQKSQQLARKLIATAKTAGQQQLTVNQQELNGLTALLHRAFPQVYADVSLSQYGGFIETSVALPLPSFMQYLNISTYILPSETGLLIEEVNIGAYTLSGDTFLSLAKFLGDKFIKKDLIYNTLAMVKRVDINKERIVAELAIDKNMLDQNNDQSLLLTLRDDLALFGDVKHISFYYKSLSKFAITHLPKSSIAPYISHVFKVASMRTNGSETSVLAENKAAVMAIIIYFGADRFELLVGDVIIRDYGSLVIRNRLRSQTTLQSRVDLQKHFIYSMALQMFSNVGASDAIGEFKEFLDSSSPNGSGFSFADLMADRAGTRLAQILTDNEQSALSAQNMLTHIDDGNLLPTIEGLQEGINEKSFDQLYQNVDSVKYRQKLELIDNRLKTLPIYQLQ